MNQTVIVFASRHHQNTRKLVQNLAQTLGFDLIDAEDPASTDLSDYERIGFASGIDFGRFYPSVEDFVKEHLPEGKSVFFLYTCARTSSRFTADMERLALDKDARILGSWGCRGYNTYGPWKWIGGMNKDHPSQQEIREAIDFCKNLL